MASDMWYLSIRGEKRGPFSDVKIKELLSTCTDASKLLVWKEGMETWVSPRELPELAASLQAAVKAPLSEAPPMVPSTAAQPAAIGRSSEAAEDKESVIEECGGLSRLGYNLYYYVGSYIVLFVSYLLCFHVITFAPVGTYDFDSSFVLWSPFYPILIWIVIHLIVGSCRLREAGYSGWRILTLFIPFYNLWTMYILFCGRNNFRRKKNFGIVEVSLIMLYIGSIICEVSLVRAYKTSSIGFVSNISLSLSVPDFEEDVQQMQKWAKGLSREDRKVYREQTIRMEAKRQAQEEFFKKWGLVSFMGIQAEL